MRLAFRLIAPLLLAGSFAAHAADPPSPPPTPEWGARDPGGRWEHGRGMMAGSHGMMTMHLLHRLDLTEAQRASIKALHEHHRAQHEQMMQDGREIHRLLAETPPTDPGYAKVVARARDHAAAKVQAMADAWAEVYAVLTPAQRTRLAELVKNPPRHERWGRPGDDRHPPTPPGPPSSPGPV